jgi:hypothetical protein
MMSHPDPKTHLLQRGWTVLADDDCNPSAWCWRLGGEIGFRVTLCAGQFSMNALSCDLDAADVYALSLLAEQTRKPAASTGVVADNRRATQALGSDTMITKLRDPNDSRLFFVNARVSDGRKKLLGKRTEIGWKLICDEPKHTKATHEAETHVDMQALFVVTELHGGLFGEPQLLAIGRDLTQRVVNYSAPENAQMPCTWTDDEGDGVTSYFYWQSAATKLT